MEERPADDGGRLAGTEILIRARGGGMRYKPNSAAARWQGASALSAPADKASKRSDALRTDPPYPFPGGAHLTAQAVNLWTTESMRNPFDDPQFQTIISHEGQRMTET